MVNAILKLIPIRIIIIHVIERLLGILFPKAKKLYEKVYELVIEAERKFLGSKRGKEKARYVKEKLDDILNDVPEYAKNLLIELAVAKLNAEQKKTRENKKDGEWEEDIF